MPFDEKPLCVLIRSLYVLLARCILSLWEAVVSFGKKHLCHLRSLSFFGEKPFVHFRTLYVFCEKPLFHLGSLLCPLVKSLDVL